MKFSTNNVEHLTVVDGPVDVPAIIDALTTTPFANDEPIYVADLDDLIGKHRNWLAKMPRVEPHYAVKCNDTDLVLSTLATLGASFDCASMAEIAKVLKLGVSPERIIFANPMKPASHLRYARVFNVQTMTFDSELELQKIKRICPDAKVVLRIRCEAELATGPLGKKFGCDPVEEAPHLMKAARSLDLELVGVSFHVGTGCGEFPVYRRAIAIARDLFDYGKTLGYEMNLLDIGGGFPGDSGTSIDEVAVIINAALDELFPDESVRVISEPGRYYVAAAFTLLTSIQSKRICLDAKTSSIERIMYFLNDGLYASFNGIMFDCKSPRPKLLGQKAGKLYDSTIWGPSCDSLDQIVESMPLPELDIDDWMVFDNMGAYTIPTASPFNGFPLPQILGYVSRENWVMLNGKQQ